MKNRWMMGWVLGILCTCLGVQAQTHNRLSKGMQTQQHDRLSKGAQTQAYDRLWKEVEQLEQKDLPQSVMAAVQQIYERAEREQNRPQLWKAYLTRMRYQAWVAPDSLEVDLRRLEQRAQQSASADERAVLYSFLGEWTLQTAFRYAQGPQREAVLQKGFAFVQQSLQESEALLQVSAAHWQPLTASGETSRLYFQDNLYDLLARRALGFFDSYRWQCASLGNQTEQLPQLVKDLSDFRQMSWKPQSAVDWVAAKFRLYQSLLTAYDHPARSSAADGTSKTSADESSFMSSAFLMTALQAMQDLHLSFPQQFTDEAYEQQLERWCTTSSKNISALPEVWLTRAEWYLTRQRFVECRQVIREALRRYPRFVRVNRLRNLERQVLLPALSLAVEPAYPGELHPLRLSYKNLKGFTLQLYKVDLPVTSPALRERVESFERKHARLQREETFTLSPTPDYRLKDTLLYFQAPQPGVYWLKAVPHGEQGKVQGKAQGELLYVTSLQALHRCLPDGKTEWVVVDGRSGHPVPGAELVTYAEMGGGYRPLQTYPTDAQGTLQLDIPKPQSMLYRVRTPQDDAMPVSSLWANARRQAPETRSKEQLKLFTDRSLYRPGQTVYVSGLAYQQLRDETQVWTDRSYIVTLLDVNGSEVGRQTVMTNSFGSFQTQFALPSTGLTGRFTLKAVSASSGKVSSGVSSSGVVSSGSAPFGNVLSGTASSPSVSSDGVRVSTDIQVEAYKRPTFEVTFEPVKDSYQVGDSLRLRGVARTFAGAPVQQAKVRYVVSRSTSCWWRRPGSGQARWEGEALTDAEGRFEVPVHFQVDASVDASVHPSVTKPGASLWYYTYQVTADVTDGAGESRQGECTLPLASVSLRMQVENVSDRWIKEKLTPIRMGVYSLTGEPLDKEVHFEIVELKGAASQSLRPSEESLRPATGKLRSSVAQLRSSMGKIRQTVWNTSEASFQEGTVVARGILRSNCDSIPEAVKNLPAGRYRWKASVTDAQGRLCTATFDFLLFSQQAQRPPVPVMDWFYTEGQEFDAEAVPTLSVGSSASDVYLFYDVFAGNRRLESRRFVFSDSILHFRFPYREDYGEGILVQVAFWKDGRLFRHETTITQPRPDKRLQLKWRTFRDKLRPGQQEEWRLQVQYPDGRPAEAELLATMYDASLDPLFRRHRLPLQLSFARWLPTVWWEQTYRNTLYCSVDFPWKSLKYPYPSYSYLVGPEVREAVEVGFVPHSRSYLTGAVKRMNAVPQAMADRMANSLVAEGGVVQDVVFESEVTPLEDVGQLEGKMQVAFGGSRAISGMVSGESAAQKGSEESVEESAIDAVLQALNGVSLRKNRQETAFFYPQLRTDAQGEVSLSFVLPESLTRWRFLGLAHTRSVDYGTLEAEVTARKEFMLQPALPRFVRVGDRTTVSASLVNLSAVAVKGKARLELFDPMTERVLFRQKQPFVVEAGSTEQVTFAFPVKEGTDVLACRMVAEGGTFSDGEQQYLPVLSNQQWVTETYPLYLNGAGRKTVALDSLFNHHSPTASGHRLTVEWTAQPLWYAVQALPVLADPRQEDAMDWAAAYYATSLADIILRIQPRIRSVLEVWKVKETQASFSSLASALTQNEELKNLLLEETPWIGDAQHQTEQRRQVATLFDANTLHSRLALALEKLRELQREDGSWSWYKGMAGSRLVTTQVLELLARLQTLSGQPLPDAARRMFQQGMDYLKKEAQAEYQQLKDAERKGKKPQLPSESAVRYLYLCVLSEGEQQSAMQRYFLDRLPQWGAGNAIYQKALAAVVLQGYGRTREAREQLQSVLEYSVYTDEQGRYFDTPKALHTWRNYQLPTQVMTLEALQRLTPEASAIGEMKRWLLKQKQVQAWESSVATADAVFALLMDPSKAVSKKISSEKTASSSEMAVSENAVSENAVSAKGLSEKVAASDLTASVSNRVTVRLGSFEMQTPVDEALGYLKQSWQEKGVAAVRQAVVEQTGSGSSWGAVYAQYRESLEQVQAQSQGVTVTRRWLRDGQKVRDENVPLQVGDRLVVELTITADRNLDFVQLKDERAACLEPVETLSGYRWNGKVGYYQASKDASTSFFFDRLPKGTYTVTYPVYVTRRGIYQSGLASVQSAYAPAFGGHTEARSLVVE